MTVDILMATYNGADYLNDQIQSIVNQNYSDWDLLISDDGSFDATIDILENWSNQDSRIEILDTGIRHGTPQSHFLDILRYSQNEYFAFSDQDDYWLPEKLTLCLKYLHSLEKKYGKKSPLMVYTDMSVTDSNLKITALSFLESSGKGKISDSVQELLMTSVAAGCTIVGNAELRKVIVKATDNVFDEKILMHDWWTLLVAACCGHVLGIHTPTVLYRQHDTNSIGAERYNVFSKMRDQKENARKYWASCKQAELLYNKINEFMPYEKKDIVAAFISTMYVNKFSVLKILRTNRLLKREPLKRIGQCMSVLMRNNEMVKE